SSSSRIAYVVVQSNFTYSKPYEIIQAPSYGLKNISTDVGWDITTNTLKAYSKGRTYFFTFETETAVPEDVTLAVDCDPTGSSGLTASAITNTSGNNYSFTITVPDSDDTDKEVTGDIDITANGITIGSFTVKRAYKPSFISVNEEIWGGVKNRPELKKATYRASEWDLKDFTSSNGNITVTKTSGQEIEIAYAETLTYDAEAQTTTITMNLNGGNKVEYNTVQRPAVFTITAADLAKLKNVAKEATNVGVTVTAQAGTSGTQWHVASTSATWLTTSPAVGGTETNASGSTLTVKFAANTTGDRTGSFVLESLNTTSPAYEVSQNGAFSATVSGVLYNGGNSAVFADGMLKAFSTACDYTFSITTNNAVAGDKLSLVSKTSGSAINIKSHPSGSALATTHSFVISVPASTLATEPESVFDIMADGNRIGGFTVKQAKKPSISVSTTAVIGGSDPVGGSFTASEWDVKSSGYVVSDNANMAVTLPSDNNGTFTVGMASSMNQSFAYRSATITLVGVTGNMATCSISQDKVLFTFAPTSVSVVAAGGSSQFTVTSSNAGTTTFPDMTAKSSQTWCTLSVSGNKVTIKVEENITENDRTANIYVTYKNCQSQAFTVTQESAYDPLATVTIGGIQWTRYNLANPAQASGGATFATRLPSQCSGNRADSHGKVYQWNRNVAWRFSDSSVSDATPSGSWATTIPNGTAWSTSPCPSGYRLPMNTEYSTLLSSCEVTPMGDTWDKDNCGYVTLTDKSNSNSTLEFVTQGYGYYSNGSLSYAGARGYYWAYDQYSSSNGYYMAITSSRVSVNNSDKRNGFSVRCIHQ
ncbi:MAG: hypothetical protein K2L01_08455, partial [Rikenellaceae bacterium]|nr:hypothetical protein [Rikenellaceae bacterium]